MHKAHLVSVHNDREEKIPEEERLSIRTSYAGSIREVKQREQGPDLKTLNDINGDLGQLDRPNPP